MKFGFFFGLFVFGLFTLVIGALSYSHINSLKNCLKEIIPQVEHQAETIRTRLDIRHQSCKTSQTKISHIRACYQKTEMDLFVPLKLAVPVAKRVFPGFPDPEKVIKTHNQYCPEYSVPYTYYIENEIF